MNNKHTIQFEMNYKIPGGTITALKCIFNVDVKLVVIRHSGDFLYSATGSAKKLREFLTDFYYRNNGFTAERVKQEIACRFPELESELEQA